MMQKGNTPLHSASLAGKLNVAKILVDAGSNVNAQSQVQFIVLLPPPHVAGGNGLTRVRLSV